MVFNKHFFTAICFRNSYRLILVAFLFCASMYAQVPPPSIYVGTFNITGAVPLTTTRVVPVPFYQGGSLILVTSNTSGAWTGCQVGLNAAGIFSSGVVGTVINWTVTLGTTQLRFIPSTAATFGPFSSIAFSFTCTTYGTNGTVAVEFIPDTTGVSSNTYEYAHINTLTSTVIRNGSGQIHTLVVNNIGSAMTVTIFDNTSCAGGAIAILSAPTVQQTFTYDATFITGLCVLTAGTTAGDLTVTFR